MIKNIIVLFLLIGTLSFANVKVKIFSFDTSKNEVDLKRAEKEINTFLDDITRRIVDVKISGDGKRTTVLVTYINRFN